MNWMIFFQRLKKFVMILNKRLFMKTDKDQSTTTRSNITDEQIIRIQRQYLIDIKPLQDSMLKILSLAIPKIVAQSPCVEYEHDYETQHKINILNEEIQKVIDIYKNRYPELFRSID